MTPETKDRIALNLALLPKKATTWVMGLASTATGFWLYLPDDTRKTILEHSPLPIWTYPLVGLVVGYVASTWPQKATAPAALAEKLDDKAVKREQATAMIFKNTEPMAPGASDAP